MIGLAACSNPPHTWLRDSLATFREVLEAAGYELDTRIFDYFAGHEFRTREGRVWRVSPHARAQLLTDLFADDAVSAIFDVSGGDLANEVLDLIDWDVVRANPKPFAGFSDLSTIVNAIPVMTGQRAVLWNPQTMSVRGTGDIDQILAGEPIRPVVSGGSDLPDTPIIGGNVRCFAKLAGTKFWPDSTGKLVLLEGLGPGLEASASYMEQMRQLGLFDGAEGLVLGQFTAIDGDDDRRALIAVAKEITKLEVWEAPEVGHSRDTAPVTIG
ncbi:muramoyltetrapeptide carboxypeptidase LdcA involved in peptidoglycan recycling [Trueperella bonasi]|uniref:Muramoyltetrapeptide carboxypeptidase LdcA involved in peptidoglycan recycling n=1 Tax=Trueperella bonasi TaxID=312286 RepID=A0ABT9NEQ7_9ACTO|nr:LD-carboxypeptidase [Trueperella bonasi]MDP9805695.1 muramoyltetrapeptide carboxypeptidase LdcA involved in peptidoglycan recycling [Trueperella bonasi]